MSVLDLPKLAIKARQMQSQMSKTKAAGKHGAVAIVINGLYSIVDDEPDKEELKKRFPDVDEDLLMRIYSSIMKDVKKALDDAKTNLQRDMASSTSMDDIKSMLN